MGQLANPFSLNSNFVISFRVHVEFADRVKNYQ
jgi:hypothetical protein